MSFGAEINRVTGANDDQAAAALGGRDTKMGKHYARHVEQENRIAFLFFSRLLWERNEIWKREGASFPNL